MSFLSRFRPVFPVLFYLKTPKFEMHNFSHIRKPLKNQHLRDMHKNFVDLQAACCMVSYS